MLHHVSLPVSNLETSQVLYDAIMKKIGYRCVFQDSAAVGYGIEDAKDQLCLNHRVDARSASEGFHLAFSAPSRQAVDEFHRVALQHGVRDNGKPGLRANYGHSYYAAFVIDIDGYRLEAVCK